MSTAASSPVGARRRAALPWSSLSTAGSWTAVGALAGWFSIESTITTSWLSPNDAQRMLFGFALLSVTLALRPTCRRRDVALLFFGWYLGAGSAIPSLWTGFFAGSAAPGVIAWLGWALIMGAPFLLAPRRRPWIGVLSGLILGAAPPLGILGMASPVLAAGALFPGWGLAGIALIAALLAISSWSSTARISEHKAVTTVLIAALLWGALQAVAYRLPAAPELAWAITTNLGDYPASLQQRFARQDDLKAQVRRAIDEGARLIVLPEGANAQWNDGQAFYWSDIAELARKKQATVLLGVYETDPLTQHDGRDMLLDLTSDRRYTSQMPMPIGMWRPWADEHYPMRAPGGGLQTLYGPALISICYEDLLLWPLIAQRLQMSAHGARPALLISAANQWFSHDGNSIAQSRAIGMQARIWGVPLLRAVNWARPVSRSPISVN